MLVRCSRGNLRETARLAWSTHAMQKSTEVYQSDVRWSCAKSSAELSDGGPLTGDGLQPSSARWAQEVIPPLPQTTDTMRVVQSLQPRMSLEPAKAAANAVPSTSTPARSRDNVADEQPRGSSPLRSISAEPQLCTAKTVDNHVDSRVVQRRGPKAEAARTPSAISVAHAHDDGHGPVDTQPDEHASSGMADEQGRAAPIPRGRSASNMPQLLMSGIRSVAANPLASRDVGGGLAVHSSVQDRPSHRGRTRKHTRPRSVPSFAQSSPARNSALQTVVRPWDDDSPTTGNPSSCLWLSLLYALAMY